MLVVRLTDPAHLLCYAICCQSNFSRLDKKDN